MQRGRWWIEKWKWMCSFSLSWSYIRSTMADKRGLKVVEHSQSRGLMFPFVLLLHFSSDLLQTFCCHLILPVEPACAFSHSAADTGARGEPREEPRGEPRSDGHDDGLLRCCLCTAVFFSFNNQHREVVQYANDRLLRFSWFYYIFFVILIQASRFANWVFLSCSAQPECCWATSQTIWALQSNWEVGFICKYPVSRSQNATNISLYHRLVYFTVKTNF